MSEIQANEAKRARRKRGAKGGGWLEPRANVWVACIKHRGPGETKAKLHRKSTGFFVDRDEKGKAQEFLRQWTAKIREGRIAPSGPPPASLRDLKDEMLRDVRLNHPRHEARTLQCFAHLEAHFSGCTAETHHCASKPATEIDGDAIAEYIEKRMDPKGDAAKAGTVNRELSALRRAFKLYRRKEASKKEKRLTTSPEIVLLVEDNVRDRCPTEKELKAVTDQLPNRLKAPIRFAALTGLRIANILGLQWAWVNEAEGTIRIPARETKGGKRAKRKKALVLPYSADPALAEILRERRRLTDDYERQHSAEGVKKAVPTVFWFEGVDGHGRQGAVPNREYARAWKRACKRAEVEDLHVHDLRRFYAARAVKAGVDENTIMKLAGWSTRSMFDRYSVRNEDDCEAAVAKMARARATERPQADERAAQAKEA